VGRQDDLDPLVASWIKTYDALFKVPVVDLPSYDGTRAVSPAFQLEIDGVIEELLETFQVIVTPLDPEERDAWIPTVMRDLGMPSRPPQIDLFVSGSATS
jgi:hypothetical protein